MKLKDADPDVPGSDYINANYIRWKSDDGIVLPEGNVDLNSKVYIATQGKAHDHAFDAFPARDVESIQVPRIFLS